MALIEAVIVMGLVGVAVSQPAVSHEWIQAELDAVPDAVAEANAALDQIRSLPPESVERCYSPTDGPSDSPAMPILNFLDPDCTAEKVIFWAIDAFDGSGRPAKWVTEENAGDMHYYLRHINDIVGHVEECTRGEAPGVYGVTTRFLRNW